MTTAASKFDPQVRCPQLLLDQEKRGEISVPMLLTMLWLHNWANWKTGIVQHASAGGLRTATARAFSVRAFQVAMKKLEKIGWITRHTVTGSHQDYPVTLHNYKWTDEAGNVHILNGKPLVVPRRALRKNSQRPLDSVASRDRATEACAEDRGEPLHVEERALSGALNKGGERDENADTSDGLARDACAEKCTEGSEKILFNTSLISSVPENKTTASPKHSQRYLKF
jgi:hypothetical protein